ncbi:MAG: hypothetical protein NT094_03600 [Candidatus Staskawiczbacteria bacterium]|nr:hypothetical protein [Candidatus Staskawiczbacteria bacterium]
MNNEIDKFRFFIIDDNNNYRSSIWFISSKKDSIYISAKTMGGSLKLSLHPDNSKDNKNCQVGITSDYVKRLKEKGYNPLSPLRWIRPSTPEKGAVCVVSIEFPTDYLKADIPKAQDEDINKKLKFALPIAKSGCAVRVDVFYSKEQPDDLLKVFEKLNITMLGYITLSDGEFVLVAAHHTLFDSKMIPDIERRFGIPLDGAPEPGKSIKNAYAIMWTEPKDGSLIILSEINGFTVHNNTSK